MMIAEILLIGIAGAGAKYLDGRGYPPVTWLRNVAFGVLALLALLPAAHIFDAPSGFLWWIGMVGVFAMSVAFAVIWTPQQKQREVLPDMLLRWAAPFASYGAGLGLFVWSPAPFAIMSAAGLLIALLVWEGARFGWTPFKTPKLDGSALVDIPIGLLAFAGLALSVRLR